MQKCAVKYDKEAKEKGAKPKPQYILQMNNKELQMQLSKSDFRRLLCFGK